MATTAKKTKQKRPSAKEREAQRKARMQIRAMATIAAGAILLGMVLVEGGSLWQILHRFLFGMFGFTAYLLPVALIYLGVLAAMDKPSLALGAKIWQTILLLFLVCGATQIFGWGLPIEEGLWAKVGELYGAGIALKGGGLASCLLGIPLLMLAGATGAKITVVVLIVFLVMVLTGTTLKGLYLIASKPVKSLEQVYAQKLMEREEERPVATKPRFNIDVPVDTPPPPQEVAAELPKENAPPEPIIHLPNSGKRKKKGEEVEDPHPEMPMHPVKSPKDSMDGAQILLRATDVLLERSQETSGITLNPSDISAISEEEKPTPKDAYLDDLIHKAVAEEPKAELPPQEGTTEEAEQTPEIPPQEGEEQPLAPIYTFPPVSLLKEQEEKDDGDITEELKANAQRLVNTLQSFGVQTRITEICRGPAVTRYELQPSAGVKISKITGLADDIALNLAAAGVRIEAPIPNKAAVGIEVPNKVVSAVGIREIVDSPEFAQAKSRLSVALGKDIAGNTTIADLAKMPHVLIAGATGSGKSVCINSIIVSLLFKASPDEVKLLMVDPKVVELGIYNGIPHLLVPVVTDPRKAAGALNWAVQEMLNRYKAFADSGVRDLGGYNRLCEESDNPDLNPMPQIVIVIDELADLMMAAPNEVEDAICRLAQMARAAGMHLVIATQRPSVDVITGVIKANIPSRIAFAVSSQVDSRTILDGSGAEKLLGRGDMLFYPSGSPKPTRVQGCFVSDKEVEKIVEFIKNGQQQQYSAEIMEEIDRQAVPEKSKGSSSDGGGFADEDEMLPAAIECVVEAGMASTSLLQRKLKLGYARAARIVDQMEERGIVGPFEGSKPRQVLISKERWMEMRLSQGK